MTKLQEKRNTLYAELSTLFENAENESRAFNDEEETKFTSLSKEIADLDKQIKRETEHRNLELDKPADNSPTEEQEIRAFEMYLKSKVTGDKALETRANMVYGDNGAVIPKTIINKIIDQVVNISPLFEKATKYYIKGDISIPKVDTSSGDISVAFASEFSSLTASAVKLVFIENYLINGGTSSTNGGTSSGLKQSVTQAMNITYGGSITADYLIDVQDTIPDVYQKNACWIMHPTTRSIIRKLKDGQNNYLLVKDFSSPTGYTLGLAVKVSEDANIQVLIEKYAEQHALGFVLWLEIDNAVENAQKIVKGSVVAAVGG